MLPSKNKPLPPTIGLDEISEMEGRLTAVLDGSNNDARSLVEEETSPHLGPARSDRRLRKEQAVHQLKKRNLPQGTLSKTGARREWTLAEVRECSRDFRSEMMRPADSTTAATICVANFKVALPKQPRLQPSLKASALGGTKCWSLTQIHKEVLQSYLA